ncbi:MAG: hypothetical protein OEV62_00250 [Actinomycetota bacterium]|nr:hypothetical protein [Actinomycetota bacterium]
MAWSNSKVFTAFVVGALDRTTAFDLDTDVPKVALFNNSITPDNTVSLANSAYNVDQWATANEVYEAGQWAQAGVALSGHDVTSATTTITYDATDTASGSAADLASVFGCLVYDDTVVGDYGICYNYFGGSNSVTNGTFTVVWNAAGILSFSVA